MKTLMYPIAPDDDFPEMFCAIRQGSGEHWFYVPEGESASWMLFRAVSENAKLRELVKAMTPFLCCMPFASCNTLAANVRSRMRELGVDE